MWSGPRALPAHAMHSAPVQLALPPRRRPPELAAVAQVVRTGEAVEDLLRGEALDQQREAVPAIAQVDARLRRRRPDAGAGRGHDRSGGEGLAGHCHAQLVIADDRCRSSQLDASAAAGTSLAACPRRSVALRRT